MPRPAFLTAPHAHTRTPRTGSQTYRDLHGDRDDQIAAMWPADRAERQRLWNESMARGVAKFWRDAGRPDLADEVRS